MLDFNGSVRGVAEKNYFVRLDCSFTDPRTNEAVQGTCVISQTGNRGLEMTNVFSSSPEVKRFRGEMDASGTVLSFTATTGPSAGSRKLIIRVLSDNELKAEAWNGNTRAESITFTRVGT